MYDFFKEFETIQSSKNYYQTLVDYYLPNDIHFNEKGNKFIANHFLKNLFEYNHPSEIAQ